MDPVYVLFLRECSAASVYLALWLYLKESVGTIPFVTIDAMTSLCQRFGVMVTASQLRGRLAKLSSMGLVELAPRWERGYYDVHVFAPQPEVKELSAPADHPRPLLDLCREDDAEVCADGFDKDVCCVTQDMTTGGGSASAAGGRFHFHFHFENEKMNRVVEFENEGQEKEYKNKTKIKQIKKREIESDEEEASTADAADADQGTEAPSLSAGSVRERVDFESPKVAKLREQVARVLYEETVHPDVIDRAVAAVVLGIGGFTFDQLRRINREAEAEQALYRDTGGNRGVRFRWMVTNLRLKRLYRLNGWAYPATRLGYEVSPFTPAPMSPVDDSSVESDASEMERCAEIAKGYGPEVLDMSSAEFARTIAREGESECSALARAGCIRSALKRLYCPASV